MHKSLSRITQSHLQRIKLISANKIIYIIQWLDFERRKVLTVLNFETSGVQASKHLTALARPWGHHQFQNALGHRLAVHLPCFILGFAEVVFIPQVTRREP